MDFFIHVFVEIGHQLRKAFWHKEQADEGCVILSTENFVESAPEAVICYDAKLRIAQPFYGIFESPAIYLSLNFTKHHIDRIPGNLFSLY